MFMKSAMEGVIRDRKRTGWMIFRVTKQDKAGYREQEEEKERKRDEIEEQRRSMEG